MTTCKRIWFGAPLVVAVFWQRRPGLVTHILFSHRLCLYSHHVYLEVASAMKIDNK